MRKLGGAALFATALALTACGGEESGKPKEMVGTEPTNNSSVNNQAAPANNSEGNNGEPVQPEPETITIEVRTDLGCLPFAFLNGEEAMGLAEARPDLQFIDPNSGIATLALDLTGTDLGSKPLLINEAGLYGSALTSLTVGFYIPEQLAANICEADETSCLIPPSCLPEGLIPTHFETGEAYGFASNLPSQMPGAPKDNYQKTLLSDGIVPGIVPVTDGVVPVSNITLDVCATSSTVRLEGAAEVLCEQHRQEFQTPEQAHSGTCEAGPVNDDEPSSFENVLEFSSNEFFNGSFAEYTEALKQFFEIYGIKLTDLQTIGQDPSTVTVWPLLGFKDGVTPDCFQNLPPLVTVNAGNNVQLLLRLEE